MNIRSKSTDRHGGLSRPIGSTSPLPEWHAVAQEIEPLAHDLEYHMETLRNMHEYRRRSAQLRDYGFGVLEKWISIKSADWSTKKTKLEQDEILVYVGVIGELFYRGKKSSPEEYDKFFASVTGMLDRLIQIIETQNPNKTKKGGANCPPFLGKIRDHPLSVFCAAKLMQTLVAAPGWPYSKHALLCYYWIIREIYTADSPSWTIGGARANTDGYETAFVTAECAVALKRFIRAQEDTGLFIDCLRRYQKQLVRLNANDEIPSQWKDQEKQRLSISCYISVHRYCKALALQFQPPKARDPASMEDYVKDIQASLQETVLTVVKAFTQALADITKLREYEESLKSDKERKLFARSKFGHDRARSALDEGTNAAVDISRKLEKKGGGDARLEMVQKALGDAADGVAQILQPMESYLVSVLEHELNAAILGLDSDWNAEEMAFAASALPLVDERWSEHQRLPEALSHLSRVMSSEGRVPTGRFFHPGHRVYSGIVITAIGNLIRRIAGEKVDLSLVKKMLDFFEVTRIRHASKDLKDVKSVEDLQYHGWFPEHHRQDRYFMASATLRAVWGLAAINRMLDDRINAVILKHFRVKEPEEITLDLDTLFYPDYGLSLITDFAKLCTKPTCKDPEVFFDDAEWPQIRELSRDESVAVTLQRMHAHVRRISLGSGEAVYCSMALHGPPGTGKTTLVEALAKSCAMPMLEVTPSDIIVGGEEAIERRARAVFEALSLLTRVIILFDEFDPVLWRRDPENSTPRSVFTFLTPGMLPKLKDLHRSAEARGCAYVLSTNLIGGLDDAAVREGRFDKKMGIYPPDPLSRVGRLLNQMDIFMDSVDEVDRDQLKNTANLKQRILKVVVSTRGAAMETLGKPEWFTAPKGSKVKEILKHPSGPITQPITPFYYIFSNSKDKKELKPAMREAYLKEPIGVGNTAIREFIQWWWIDRWDETVEGVDVALETISEKRRKENDVVGKLKKLLCG